MRINKYIAWLLVASMLLSVLCMPANVSYAQEYEFNETSHVQQTFQAQQTVTQNVYGSLTPEQQLQANLTYLAETVDNPTFGMFDGEWTILSLARADYPVADSYYDLYYNNVVSEVQRLISISRNQGNLDRNKGSEHSRLILALTAIGRDIYDVGGYDVTRALADFDFVVRQGINGPIYALIAFDSKHYEIPLAEEGKTQTTRENLVDYILEKEIHKGTDQAGGWALTGTIPDPDITGMALQALVPYASNEKVSAAIERAVAWLSKAQNDNGGFSSWNVENSESIAQVIVALTAHGIDPHHDPRFIKNGRSAIDALLSYALPGGGFKHISSGSYDAMATDQGTYALVAYDRFVKGMNRLYDMTDVKAGQPEIPAEPEVPQVPESPQPGGNVISLPEGDKQVIDIPHDDHEYIVSITAADSNKQVSLNIPQDKTAQTIVSLPFQSDLPQIEAVKGDVSVVIAKSTQVLSGDTSAMEWLTFKEPADVQSTTEIESLLPKGTKLDGLVKVITLGGSSKVEFSDYVTLVFKGMGSKEAAYVQNGQTHLITKYANEGEGGRSGKAEYAYANGNDLIVRTKHLTDFIVYSTAIHDIPDDGIGNGGGGPVVVQPKKTVTLSVDKMTINKGYVIAPVRVELQDGDTAWSVLQRMLNQNNIHYEYTWNEKYGSMYVQSIDGDGEFDHGSDSGWMYNVNGYYPEYGASLHILKDGDTVQWRYTTNLGADLGKDNSQWQQPPQGGIGNPGSVVNPDIDTEAPEISKPDADKVVDEESIIDLMQHYSDASSISAWAYEAVREATQKGFVQGSNGQFKPQKPITRAEFTKMMVEILGLDIEEETVIRFNDVNEKDWFFPYVNAAYHADVVSGASERSFMPYEQITREQMAVMVIRALGLQSSKPTVRVVDLDNVSNWAKTSVETAVSSGLMIGHDGYFNPKDTATREMATVTAIRAYHVLEGQPNAEGQKFDEAESSNAVHAEVLRTIEKTAAFLQEAVPDPTISVIGGEWVVLGLARSHMEISEDYYATYYANVEKKLTELSGKLHHVKYTEYDRVILALTSIGKRIDDVAGYDLRVPLVDYDTLTKQGINGPIFALIALDSKEYEIPTVSGVKTPTTRELLIQHILDREIEGGGWALGQSPSESDPDVTAMAIQALTPYYTSNKNVKDAVDRGIVWLSKAQKENGDFSSWGTTNLESTAQVIVALTGLGIDPHLDLRFIKNGWSPVDALLSYAASNGGFYHVKPSKVNDSSASPAEVDLMATEQAMYALTAYDRFVRGQSRLYDMTDVN